MFAKLLLKRLILTSRMHTILLRLVKRRTSWEPEIDLDETMETEFHRNGQIDLRLSVYEVEPRHEAILRVHAEHAATFLQDPPHGGNNLDLRGVETLKTTGASRFKFTREFHRELVFQDEAELREFISGMCGSLKCRIYRIEKKQIREYITSRFKDGDPEWLAFCKDTSHPKSWGCG